MLPWKLMGLLETQICFQMFQTTFLSLGLQQEVQKHGQGLPPGRLGPGCCG